MHHRHSIFVVLACLAVAASALSTPEPRPLSRRFLLRRIPLVIAASGGASTAAALFGDCLQNGGSTCRCVNCGTFRAVGVVAPAMAYERRDVGGADASAATKAMNDQAYETNNRLERAGLKLETAEQQSSALTAELSQYAYTPTTSTTPKKERKIPARKIASTE